VPPIWLAIARSSEVTDHFDSLEIAGTGAAPMSTELAKEAASKVGQGRISIVTQLYGATETTGSITGIAWDATDETVSLKRCEEYWCVVAEPFQASSGAPFANIRCRFVNENDQDVEEGQPGELLVAGPFVCKGRHRRFDIPQATTNQSKAIVTIRRQTKVLSLMAITELVILVSGRTVCCTSSTERKN
jgi:4-coumarate--CoA ligase